ncbi:MAG: sugar phosphate isomerase/epimerase [Fulvivirga sp.]
MKNNLRLRILTIALFACFSLSAVAQKQFGGLALYTVRDDMKNDPKGVLKQVADAGYKYVEDAGYSDGKFYGMTPTEFKSTLSELGLEPISSHQGGITYENADQTIADLKAVGFKYLVVPIPPMGHFKYYPETKSMGMTGGAANLAEILNILGEKCTKAGLKLLYHNHDFEYKKDADGIVTIDYLLENTDPKHVNFQMDLFWVTKAEASPTAYFEKYPGRFIAWHVKDMDEEGKFAPVGNGTIDFAKILAEKKASGMKYYFVEQDQTFNMKPLEAIKVSHKALEEIGFK